MTQNPTNKPGARQALQDYTDSGGRVFASHWHNYWFEPAPLPLPGMADFNHQADLANPFTAHRRGSPRGPPSPTGWLTWAARPRSGELLDSAGGSTRSTRSARPAVDLQQQPGVVQYLDLDDAAWRRRM